MSILPRYIDVGGGVLRPHYCDVSGDARPAYNCDCGEDCGEPCGACCFGASSKMTIQWSVSSWSGGTYPTSGGPTELIYDGLVDDGTSIRPQFSGNDGSQFFIVRRSCSNAWLPVVRFGDADGIDGEIDLDLADTDDCCGATGSGATDTGDEYTSTGASWSIEVTDNTCCKSGSSCITGDPNCSGTCGVPCSCPDSLASSYAIAASSLPCSGEATANFTVTGTCPSWSGSPPPSTSITSTLTLETAGDPNCFWKVVITCDIGGGDDSATYEKDTGGTPVGTYTRTVDGAFASFPATITVS